MSNQPITHPFIDYRGNAWKQHAIDTYNRINAEVAKRDTQPTPKSLAAKELDFYKDQRHKTFVQLADIAASN